VPKAKKQEMNLFNAVPPPGTKSGVVRYSQPGKDTFWNPTRRPCAPTRMMKHSLRHFSCAQRRIGHLLPQNGPPNGRVGHAGQRERFSNGVPSDWLRGHV